LILRLSRVGVADGGWANVVHETCSDFFRGAWRRSGACETVALRMLKGEVSRSKVELETLLIYSLKVRRQVDLSQPDNAVRQTTVKVSVSDKNCFYKKTSYTSVEHMNEHGADWRSWSIYCSTQRT